MSEPLTREQELELQRNTAIKENERLTKELAEVKLDRDAEGLTAQGLADLLNTKEQQLTALQKANNPFCLLCGKTEPCMTEADLQPTDPGIPCTFDYTPLQMLQIAKQYKQQLTAMTAERDDAVDAREGTLMRVDGLQVEIRDLKVKLTASEARVRRLEEALKRIVKTAGATYAERFKVLAVEVANEALTPQAPQQEEA